MISPGFGSGPPTQSEDPRRPCADTQRPRDPACRLDVIHVEGLQDPGIREECLRRPPAGRPQLVQALQDAPELHAVPGRRAEGLCDVLHAPKRHALAQHHDHELPGCGVLHQLHDRTAGQQSKSARIGMNPVRRQEGSSQGLYVGLLQELERRFGVPVTHCSAYGDLAARCSREFARRYADARSARECRRRETPVQRRRMRRRGFPGGPLGPWCNNLLRTNLAMTLTGRIRRTTKHSGTGSAIRRSCRTDFRAGRSGGLVRLGAHKVI